MTVKVVEMLPVLKLPKAGCTAEIVAVPVPLSVVVLPLIVPMLGILLK